MAVSSHVESVLGLSYDELPALLTAQQFAQLVQLREFKILQLLREGSIPAVRLGGPGGSGGFRRVCCRNGFAPKPPSNCPVVSPVFVLLMLPPFCGVFCALSRSLCRSHR